MKVTAMSSLQTDAAFPQQTFKNKNTTQDRLQDILVIFLQYLQYVFPSSLSTCVKFTHQD